MLSFLLSLPTPASPASRSAHCFLFTEILREISLFESLLCVISNRVVHLSFVVETPRVSLVPLESQHLARNMHDTFGKMTCEI